MLRRMKYYNILIQLQVRNTNLYPFAIHKQFHPHILVAGNYPMVSILHQLLGMIAGLPKEDICFLLKTRAPLNYLQLLNKLYGEFLAETIVLK